MHTLICETHRPQFSQLNLMKTDSLRFPSVYIAGTQKGGTTSLHFLLQSHRNLYFPASHQELHYFDVENNYAKGLTWLSKHYDDAPAGAILAQTSPLYMYLRKVPVRIAELNNASKFIFILRNPIDRAYSHYWNSVKYGFERLSFEQALKQEPQRIVISEEHQRNHSYVDRGFYTAQIQRFIDIFGKRAVLLLTQDELKKPTPTVRQSIANFLEIDIDGFNVSSNRAVHNPAKLPRFTQLQRLRPPLDRHSFSLGVRFIDKINLVKKQYPPMKNETREELRQTYRDELNQFSELISDGVDYQAEWN